MPKFMYLVAVGVSMSAAVYLASEQAPSAKAAPVKARQTSVLNISVPAQQLEQTPVKSVDYEDSQLETIIKQFAASHPDHQWSVQLRGLGNDERAASFDATKDFRSASIYKLLMMYPLTQKIPMDQWNSTELSVDGHARSLSDCVTAMLRVSDNPCGKAVGDYIGWEYIDSQLSYIGLNNTHLDDNNGPRTTAADVAYYLQGLAEGRWFDGDAHNLIIKTLDQQILRGGIPTGCGSGCAVADKTGDLGFVRHDAGIVRYAGGSYVLSIFTDGASYGEIADLAAQLQAFMAS